MSALPTLDLTFRNVAGDPWEGEAVARYQGDPREPFPVREGLTSKQRETLRWYVEEYLDFPEGGYVTRARRIEGELGAGSKGLLSRLAPGAQPPSQSAHGG
jgi:hypothetical protein